MSDALFRPISLPIGGVGRKAVGWWGMLCLIASEASIFAYLLFSYYFYNIQSGGAWLPTAHPSFRLALPNTIILLLSSVAVWWGERAARRGNRAQIFLGLFAGILLGAAFMVVQWMEWRGKPFSISSSLYGSIYFTTTGFHMVHVLVGLLVLGVVLIWSIMGYFDRTRNVPILIGTVYWHFVDAVWLTLFFTFYLMPYLW